MSDLQITNQALEMAENYAAHYVPAVTDIWTPETLVRLQARPGDAVLDVGCATGASSFNLLRLIGPGGRVVGIDIEPAPLVVANRIRKALDRPNISFQNADVSALHYPDAVFDRVVCQHTLMFVHDKSRAVREMYRVLSRRGRLVISVWGPRQGVVHEALLADVFRTHLGEEPGFFTSAFSLSERGIFEHLLRDAELRNQAVFERARVATSFSGAEAYWQGMVEGRSLALRVAALPEPARAALKAEVLSRLRAYRSPSGYIMPMEGIIATITKP